MGTGHSSNTFGKGAWFPATRRGLQDWGEIVSASSRERLGTMLDSGPLPACEP